jgi:hypothetical protein
MMMSEIRTARIIEIWHSSKIRIQSGSIKTFLRLPQDAQSETARFGGHTACLLSVGTELTFRQDENGSIHSVKFDVETPDDVPEFEDSTIVEWHPQYSRTGCGYGFAQRGCAFGCRIYCRDDADLITQGVLKVGSWINHSIQEQNDGRMKATKISIYQEAKEL